MAQTLSFSPLALDLPNSRISVDFATFKTSTPQSQNALSGKQRLPRPRPVRQLMNRNRIARPALLPEVQEEAEPVDISSAKNPDRMRYLADSQRISVADKPVQPNRASSRTDALSMVQRPGSKEEKLYTKSQKAVARRMGLPWARRKGHARRDSNENLETLIKQDKESAGVNGMGTSGRSYPPSVEELQKIAEDIKNGLY